MQENRTPGQHKSTSGPSSDHLPRKRPIYSFLLAFVIMLGLWIILSGRFDLFHLSLGVVSGSIVAWFSGDLLFNSPITKGLLGSLIRLLLYIPWLLYQIFLANLHMIYLAFHPRMLDLIDPKIIEFKSNLQKELSLATLANSITLTPGTITVSVSVEGDFSVHVIDKKSAEDLPGEMEGRISRTFRE